jgi:hypothetical protein
MNAKNDFVDRINYIPPYPKITAAYFNLRFLNYKFKNPSSVKGNPCGLYFCIHFHIDTWLLLTNLQDNAFFLHNDKRKKYIDIIHY